MNSSEAFDRLVNGIARGNVLILRNIGINVNLQTAYRQMADALGKTTKELTENERVEARRLAVFERGTDINGTYTASMDTASKQITSMQRYISDLKMNHHAFVTRSPVVRNTAIVGAKLNVRLGECAIMV